MRNALALSIPYRFPLGRRDRARPGLGLLALAMVLWLVVWPRAAVALTSDLPPAQQQHRVWTAREGLPAEIRAMAQTSDGFLWLGTYRGLFRFDGVNFEQAVDLGLPEDSRKSVIMLRAEGLRLDIGFNGGGGAIWENGRWLAFGAAQHLYQVNAFVRRPDGEITVEAAGRLWTLVDGRLEPALRGGDCEPSELRDLVQDSTGNVWSSSFANVQVIYQVARGAHTCRREDLPFHARAMVGGGDLLWMASDEGTWVASTSPADGNRAWKRLSSDPSMLVYPAANGDVYVNARSSLLRFANAREWAMRGSEGPPPAERFGIDQGLAEATIQSFAEDRQGNLWVGGMGTLERLRTSRFVWIDMPWRRWSVPYRLAPTADGAIVAGNEYEPGLVRIYGDHAEPILGSERIPLVAQLHGDKSGTLWIASSGDLLRWPPGQPWQTVAGLKGRIAGTRSITSDSLGAIWVDGNPGGKVARVGPDGRVDQPPVIEGLSDRWEFRGGIADATGRLWFGTAPGVRIVENGASRLWSRTTHGLSFGNVCTFFVRDGRLWAGATRGAGLADGDTFHPLHDLNGRPLGAITGVVETADGDLWMNGEEATYYVPAAELRKVLPELAQPVNIRRLDASDGRLGLTEFSEATPTLVQDARGRLWVTTSAGIARIDGRGLSDVAFPDLQVTSLVAAGHMYRPPGLASLPALANTLTIRYAATDLAAPEKIRFRYKLSGLDGAWHDAETLRSASFTNLGPGRYTFHLASTNSDGVWNPVETSFEFDIAPAWWQTTIFRACCALACALLLYAAYRIRLMQVSRRFDMSFEARVNERLRIARDLHDTLLQTFQGHVLRLQTALQLWPREAGRQTLEEGIAQAAEAITEGRDAVQGLRSGTMETVDLADSVRALGQAHASGVVRFGVEVSGRPRRLHPIVHDEVARIVGEALRNAFVHAEPAHVDVEIRYVERELRVRIVDDGKGMESATVQQGRPGHYGLTGMRERAKLIGGKLTLWSRRGAGTEVDLIIPATRAYTLPPDSTPSGRADTPAGEMPDDIGP